MFYLVQLCQNQNEIKFTISYCFKRRNFREITYQQGIGSNYPTFCKCFIFQSLPCFAVLFCLPIDFFRRYLFCFKCFLISAWINPCAAGTPVMGLKNKPATCIVTGVCPEDHYCHFGETDQTTVCCPKSGLSK